MSLEKMIKAALGDGADKSVIDGILNQAKEDSTALLDTETKGLKINQQKLLDKQALLKQNQMPEGFDKEAYSKYMTDHAKFETDQAALELQKLEDKGQWEGLKEKLINAQKTTMETLTADKDSQISSLRGALDKELVENASIKAIEHEKGNSFFLLPHMKGQIKTVDDEGKFSVAVIDPKTGQVRENEDGTPFTIENLVAEMKANDTYALAFPNGNTGSGNDVNSGGTGGNSINPWKSATKNVTAQAKMNKENPVLATQMRKAAGAS